ncbi:SDR family NAD(P)-dependent oxidoreductase [Pararhizobium sp. IMCC21322]|uniref:SDR family NAD(P)-dependent oxidoreductase n=1 Tax=Pararhizobium sp. IMCC21322 TaxID=3067903 RepID=UPI002740E868|nr:SDR family oxidoreductase [Pararhizobium sp. IMCC21322]
MTRHALITGAAGDLGSAVAVRLAEQGDRVVLVDIDGDRLDAVLGQLPGNGHRKEILDVSNEAAVMALAQTFHEHGDGLDAVFNNAGVNGATVPIAEHTLDDFRHTFEVNVFGSFLIQKHMLPLLAERGDAWLLNTASEAGTRANARRGCYAATKAAVIQLTRAVALEYGEKGVRVNVLCPGPIEGQFMDRSEAGLPDPKAARKMIASASALGRYASADEIAQHVCYLLTAAPPYLNGSVQQIDGCRR